MKHTKLPWESMFIDKDVYRIQVENTLVYVATVKGEANAELMVQACNSHYDLLEALKTLLDEDRLRKIQSLIQKYPADPILDQFERIFPEIYEILSKAEGK